MAFLAPLLSAGMSSGILPNIIKGVGGFVSDLIGGIGSGKPVLDVLESAAKKGLTTALGGSADHDPVGTARAALAAPQTNIANSRPIVVPRSAGLVRLVQFRPRMSRSDSRNIRRDDRRRRKYRAYYIR